MHLNGIIDGKCIVTRYAEDMADAEIREPIQGVSHDRRSHQAFIGIHAGILITLVPEGHGMSLHRQATINRIHRNGLNQQWQQQQPRNNVNMKGGQRCIG